MVTDCGLKSVIAINVYCIKMSLGNLFQCKMVHGKKLYICMLMRSHHLLSYGKKELVKQ